MEIPAPVLGIDGREKLGLIKREDLSATHYLVPNANPEDCRMIPKVEINGHEVMLFSELILLII